MRIVIFLIITLNIGGCENRQYNFNQEGKASYYSNDFEGSPTANGETFDPQKMTAAHKFLPFGTQVKVSNPENDHNVMVRINDRGPYADNRIIDLSPRAAEKLGIKEQGVARIIIKAQLDPSIADSLQLMTR